MKTGAITESLPKDCVVGKGCKIDNSVIFNMHSDSILHIGNNVEIRPGTYFEAAKGGTIIIGDNCVIGMNNWFQGSGLIKIGSFVLTAPNVVLLSTSHKMKIEKNILQQPLAKGKLEIGNDVWIGANCTLKYNIKIDDKAVVGANSFVNMDVDKFAVVGGVPAQFLYSRRETEDE